MQQLLYGLKEPDPSLLHQAMELLKTAYPSQNSSDSGAAVFSTSPAARKLSKNEAAASLRSRFGGSQAALVPPSPVAHLDDRSGLLSPKQEAGIEDSPANWSLSTASELSMNLSAATMATKKEEASLRTSIRTYDFNLDADGSVNVVSSGAGGVATPTKTSERIESRIRTMESHPIVEVEHSDKSGQEPSGQSASSPEDSRKILIHPSEGESTGESKDLGSSSNSKSSNIKDEETLSPHNVQVKEERRTRSPGLADSSNNTTLQSSLIEPGSFSASRAHTCRCFFLLPRLVVVGLFAAVFVWSQLLVRQSSTSSEGYILGRWMELWGGAAFALSGWALVVEFLPDWDSFPRPHPRSSKRVVLNSFGLGGVTLGVGITGATLLIEEESMLLVLGDCSMIFSTISLLALFPVLLRYRREAKQGKGWFFGHETPDRFAFIWAMAVYTTAIALSAIGFAGAYLSILGGAFSTHEQFAMVEPWQRGCFWSSVATAVVGLLEGMVAVSLASGVDVDLVKTRFFTVVLPMLLVVSAGSFLLVYSCLVFLLE